MTGRSSCAVARTATRWEILYNIRFREDAKFLFPELADIQSRAAAEWRGGNGSAHLGTPDFDGGGCSIDHLVFLRRARSGRPSMNRMEAMAASEARHWLGTGAPLYGPQEVRVSQRQAYRRLLDAGLWELHYSELQDAVEIARTDSEPPHENRALDHYFRRPLLEPGVFWKS